MMAIKNFGLFWEKRLIYWGYQGVKGALLGYRKGVSRADFREQMGVYLLYDSHKEVVYIGQAGKGNSNLFSRLKQHCSDHLWNRWDYFSWFGLCKVNSNGNLSMADNPDRKIGGSVSDALDEIESMLIQIFEPRLNKKGGNWKGTHEYFQLQHENIEDHSIEELARQQKEILGLIKNGK